MLSLGFIIGGVLSSHTVVVPSSQALCSAMCMLNIAMHNLPVQELQTLHNEAVQFLLQHTAPWRALHKLAALLLYEPGHSLLWAGFCKSAPAKYQKCLCAIGIRASSHLGSC